jgi:hypothetical protein
MSLHWATHGSLTTSAPSCETTSLNELWYGAVITGGIVAGAIASVAGFGIGSLLSGLLGGLVGNQGGIRSAAMLGVVCGTLFGHRVLMRIPEEKFRPTAGLLLAVLGAAMLIIGIRSP